MGNHSNFGLTQAHLALSRVGKAMNNKIRKSHFNVRVRIPHHAYTSREQAG